MVINTNDYICLHVENYLFLDKLSSVYMMSQDLCDVLMTWCLPHDLALTDPAVTLVQYTWICEIQDHSGVEITQKVLVVSRTT